MVKFSKTWTLDGRGIGGVVLLIAVLSIGSAFAGGQYASTTVTLASTTQQVVTTVLSTQTLSYTMTSSTTIIVTTMSVVTQTGPDQVVVSGTAKANGLIGQGVSATKITFTSASNNATVFSSPISTAGGYSVTLDNNQFYNVKIFGSTIGGLSAGSCGAGAVAIAMNKPTGSLSGFDFSC